MAKGRAHRAAVLEFELFKATESSVGAYDLKVVMRVLDVGHSQMLIVMKVVCYGVSMYLLCLYGLPRSASKHVTARNRNQYNSLDRIT